MRHVGFVIACLWLSAVSYAVQAAVTVKVCGQNLQNYYYNYTESSRPSYTNEAGFLQKTNRIVNAVLTIDADIYAFCELEGTPDILDHLVTYLNTAAGVANRYAAVADGIQGVNDSYDNNLKSGFVYRTDRVRPYGSNTAASTATYYKNVMRIQAFEELTTRERFVLSMNHFKAKDSSADQGDAKRQTNANNLVRALKRITTDPDILVLGDLNCEYGETPISIIINAGYEEQLLRFDSTAYSYCYNSGELIDHVLANASMRAQVTDAYVYHNCTYRCNSRIRNSYSDHDPYVVTLSLGAAGTDLQSPTETAHPAAYKTIEQGRLIIILPDGSKYSVTGTRIH